MVSWIERDGLRSLCGVAMGSRRSDHARAPSSGSSANIQSAFTHARRSPCVMGKVRAVGITVYEAPRLKVKRTVLDEPGDTGAVME